MTLDEIMAQLNSGKTIDDLATEYAALLNQAQDKMKEDKEKQNKENTLNTIAENISRDILDYLSAYNSKLVEEMGEDELEAFMDVPHLREILDSTIDLVASFSKIEKMDVTDLIETLKKLDARNTDSLDIWGAMFPDNSKANFNTSEPVKISFKTKAAEPKSDSEKISDFLKSLGLK